MLTMLDVLRRRHAAPTHAPHEEIQKQFRVGLTDIDLNLHLNNAKYLRYMDLARLEHMLATGMLWKLWPARTNPIVANNEISYIRELRTFQKFTVTARIIGADDKYLYYDQRFLSDGKLCTHAFLRLACVHRHKSRPMAEVLDILGMQDAMPPLPEPALIWKDMLDAKKNFALGKPAKTVTETSRHVA